MSRTAKISFGIAGAAAVTAAFGIGGTVEAFAAEAVPDVQGAAEETVSEAQAEPQDYYEAKEQEEAARVEAETAGAETAEARAQAEAAEAARREAEAAVKAEEDAGKAAEEANAGVVNNARNEADAAAQAQEEAARTEEEARTAFDGMKDVTDEEIRTAGDAVDTAVADAMNADAAAHEAEAAKAEAENAAKKAAQAVTDAEAAKSDAEAALEKASSDKAGAETAAREAADVREAAQKEYDDALAARENIPDVTAEDVAKAETDADKARIGKESADAKRKEAEDAAGKAAATVEADAAAKAEADAKAGKAAETEAEARSSSESADEELEKAKEALDFYEKVRAGEAEIQDSTEYKELTEAQTAYNDADKALKDAEDALAQAKADEKDKKTAYNAAKKEADEAKTAYDAAKAASDALTEEAEALKAQGEALDEEIAAATEAAAKANKAKAETAKALKDAEAAVSDAQNALTALEEQVQTAQSDMEEAQASYDKAYAQYLDGAYGFYEWLAKNYTEIEEGYKYSTAEIAERSLKIFETESIAKYQNRGSIYDSTAVPAVQGAIRYMRECNEIRKAAGKNELRVDLMSMAVAQASLDYALVEEEHSPIAGYENLITFATNDPYALWYYWEKENLESGNGQQTGHYYNIIRDYDTKREWTANGKVIRVDEYEGVMGYATTFLPAGTYEGVSEVYIGHVQEFAKHRKGTAKTYTIDEFEDLFNTYLNTIDLEGKQAALDAASGVLDKAKEALEAGKTALASAKSERKAAKAAADKAAEEAKAAKAARAALVKQQSDARAALNAKEAEAASAQSHTDEMAAAYDAKVSEAADALADYNGAKTAVSTLQAECNEASEALDGAAGVLSRAEEAYRALTSDDTMKALADNVIALTKTAAEKAAELAEKTAAREDADKAARAAAETLAASERTKAAADRTLASAKKAAKDAADQLSDAAIKLADTRKAYALATDIEGEIQKAAEALEAAKTAWADAVAELNAKTADVDAKESALSDAAKAVADAQALSEKAEKILAKKTKAENLAKAAAEAKAGDAKGAQAEYDALLTQKAAYDAAKAELDRAVKNREAADKAFEDAAGALAQAQAQADADKEAHASELESLREALRAAKEAEEAAKAAYDEKNTAYIKALADYSIAKDVTQSFLPMHYNTTISVPEITHLDGTPVSLVTDSRETALDGVLVDGVQLAEDRYSYDPETQTVAFARDFIDSLAKGDHEVTVRYELGSGTASFAVKAVDLTDTIIDMVDEAVYTGQDIIPPVSVTYNGMELENGKDYEVICSNNRNAGTAFAAIRGIGGFTNEEMKTFTIRPAEIKTEDVGNFGTVFIATGAPVRPEPVVMHDGRTLVRDTDYTVEYENNIAEGLASLTVEGIGNYAGKVRTSFRLVADTPKTADPVPADKAPVTADTAPNVRTVVYAENGRESGESTVAKAANGVTASVLSFYRLYDPGTGECLYTADESRKNACVKKGWQLERICSRQPAKGTKAVYSLYNPNTEEHFFTAENDEIKTLTGLGWVNEGVAFYSDPDEGKVVRRLYNELTGRHHYTADMEEFDNFVRDGWTGEGIAWYGLADN